MAPKRERLVVIGAGGFAREVLDVVEAINLHSSGDGPSFEVVGVLADPPPTDDKLAAYGTEYLGGVDTLRRLPGDIGYVIGIGSAKVRQKIDSEFRMDRRCPTLVHPSATVGREVVLGPGSVVCSHVSITNHIALGRHVHLNLNCTVGHDSTIGDYATLSPLVAISGNVTVQAGAFFGTGAVVNPGVTVGAWSVIGSGAAAVREIPSNVTAVGVPAKVLAQ